MIVMNPHIALAKLLVRSSTKKDCPTLINLWVSKKPYSIEQIKLHEHLEKIFAKISKPYVASPVIIYYDWLDIHKDITRIGRFFNPKSKLYIFKSQIDTADTIHKLNTLQQSLSKYVFIKCPVEFDTNETYAQSIEYIRYAIASLQTHANTK